MDLKEIVEQVENSAKEARSAYHAGHRDVAEEWLGKIGIQIAGYITDKAMPAGDVTESATSEKETEAQTEKPAEVPGAPAQPAPGAAAAAARSIGRAPVGETRTQ